MPPGSLTRACAKLTAMNDERIADKRYELVIRGELDARYAYLFEGMRMEGVEGTTVITGPVRDQAQLYGFIERLEEFGLELISIQETDEA
jgi:hypothetical protein